MIRLDRWIRLESLLVLSTLCLTSSRAVSAGDCVEKPNILFLFTDDQTWDAVHALGGAEVITPNLDQLARKGLIFSRAYNMGAWHGAVCVASRTMLNTGLSLWRAREREPDLSEDVRLGKFWAQRLARAGYETYFTGKWHVQADVHRIFGNQRVHHVRPGMPDQTDAGYDRPQEGVPDTWQPWDPSRGGYWQGGRHWSEIVADDAIEFLEQAAAREAPFFIYVAFNAPHDPRQSPKEYLDQYPLSQIAIPRNFMPEYPFAEAIGCGRKLRDERLAPFPRTEYAVRVHRQEYYAIITHLDTQIGRVMDALNQTSLASNTYIFLTSDQGLAVGHHGLLGKQNMFDHSVRVPMMVAGPNIPAGNRIETAVYLQDIMPTTLELAGVAPDTSIEFHSLLPLIRGTNKESYRAIYGAYRHLQRMVTKKGFKLIVYPEVPRILLFDLRNDPEELHDLANDPAYRETLRDLFSELLRFQAEMGDTLDLGPADPIPADCSAGAELGGADR